jgi:hypothetical protein
MTTIQRLRDYLGPPGKRDPQRLADLSLAKRPSWATFGPIQSLFEHHEELLARGSICWAYLVMANSVMWEPGSETCAPASVVWSEDPFVDRFPHWLERPASHLGKYHSNSTASPNPPVAYREYLRIRDEMLHVSHVKLPPHMTGGRVVYSQTVLLMRAHLPLGYLTGSLFPLLQLRASDVPPTAMVFPANLWPPELRRSWERT